jgi:hypothetical protein
MQKLIAAGLGLAILWTFPVCAASQTDTLLFGKDPGDKAFACYTRHYDEAHLKGHPQQNVTDMTLLVESQGTGEDKYYSLSIGVDFRKAKGLQVAGGCGSTVANEKLLNCAVDCDGGAIDVRLKDADSVLIDIPNGARTWNPLDDTDEDAGPDPSDNPDAAFGPDDKTFRVDRAALNLCTDLVSDDEDKKLLTAAE